MKFAEVIAKAEGFKAVVCVQGMGFVGTAMAAAIASAVDDSGDPLYLVIGVDQASTAGQDRVETISAGRLPFTSTDHELNEAFGRAVARGNLLATTDPDYFRLADVAVVDIHLDVDFTSTHPSADLKKFGRAISALASRMPAGGLIIIETTVPPGTTDRVAAPVVSRALHLRGLPKDAIGLAHSYERVMPGPDYLKSIVRYWRVYAGVDDSSAQRCAKFLQTVIDTENFPLTRLGSTTASETAKVLENSYRAVNIALLDEWSRFAEHLGIDLFEVVDAIRVRPTHSNLREPGLGVGGYCLTKDPLFPQVSMAEFYPEACLEFPITSAAMEINAKMPQATVDRLKQVLGDSLEGRRILVLGAAYRSDIGDTRHSASEVLVRRLLSGGAIVRVHDPFAVSWGIAGAPIENSLPNAVGQDAVVFAVGHTAYTQISITSWLSGSTPWLIDANHVLTAGQRSEIVNGGYPRLFSIGRGFQ